LDADMAEIREAQRRLPAMDRSGEDAAGARAVDLEEALHHRRRAADLVAGDRAETARAQVPMQRLLHVISGSLVAWPAVVGQGCERLARQPRVGEQGGGTRAHRAVPAAPPPSPTSENGA